MPTADRRRFVSRALDYFLRQDYPHKELIVIDDGSDDISDLLVPDDRLRHVRPGKTSQLGTKRNLACQLARGSLIAHWDDDDWYAPHRLSHQVQHILQSGAAVSGVTRPLFLELGSGRAWSYVGAQQNPWYAGASLCYRRSFWASHPFADVETGEDSLFVRAAASQVAAAADREILIALIHDANTSPKYPNQGAWEECSAERLRTVMQSDWDAYVDHNSARDWGDVVAARHRDLHLPEYRAFNHGQTLPWMRRWELTYALFAARLTDTAAVLDLTINPCGFETQLRRLFPHVLYRHWNPLRAGGFELPLGIPDGAFDRVICVNTLEHLLAAQRDALLAEVNRKLKPDGWAVITADYYFASALRNHAFLDARVMRPDGAEVFNGWNRVSVNELIASCRRNGLHPSPASAVEEPREDDLSLYLQRRPYNHACIGITARKGSPGALPHGRRILLSLLTWNTCAVSLDSLRAHVEEARMLRRLGHLPFVCVVDNGSTDGTAEAIEALAPQIDVPFRFIVNPANLGISVGRNQLLHHMRAIDADYWLMLDGDIEIVPFSSLAMLRYMESQGERLGCIGADSGGQSPRRDQATPVLYAIDPARTQTVDLVAWTQYGLFRRAVFDAGVRFDEAGPFSAAGWGFEDNDLAFEMEVRGFVNQRFFGMVYLHRALSSSIRIMREQGIDVEALYQARRQRVVEKWQDVPRINNGPLVHVRRVSLRV
jgi:glycosyltransferase involved in cell wall biosynthesis